MARRTAKGKVKLQPVVASEQVAPSVQTANPVANKPPPAAAMTSIAFLESVNLAKYHAALAEAGASECSDFIDLDEVSGCLSSQQTHCHH